MTPERRAVVDIGTNSVKLLVAEVAGEEIRPVRERGVQTRLGLGLYTSNRLSQGAIANTARVVAEFTGEARQMGSAVIRIIATSAAREARNPEELKAAVRAACGLPVTIISGEEEGDLAFRGVLSDPRFHAGPVLILDAGGGSTEFILGDGKEQEVRQSFPLGAVRILEALQPTDPPTPAELERCRASVRNLLRDQVVPLLRPRLDRHPVDTVSLVGTGGTASVLGAMELGLTSFQRERLEATRLTREQVRRRLERLWGLPLEERRKLPGLPPERADIILTGTAIYSGVMEELSFTEMRISTRGLRFAALLDAA